MGKRVAGFDGGDSVEEVLITDGDRIAADIVVVGVGVVPRTELAEAAGLRINDGIVVDEHLRPATSASSPPATWPRPGTPSTSDGCGSSTGPTPVHQAYGGLTNPAYLSAARNQGSTSS
jgi:hypothetical protein